MAVSTNEFTGILNGLVETCKDGEQGFRESAENLKDSSVRQAFLKYSQQRADYARELQAEITRLGGTADTDGSVSGAVHRGWINLKAAITGRDDKAVINEAERGEDIAMEQYQKALAQDIPSDLRSLVERQYKGVQEAHNYVRNLKHGLQNQ